MDIFDTFFLVEYLRQWAGRGRIVIMTLQPPTYEILTMISKVLLLSTGSYPGPLGLIEGEARIFNRTDQVWSYATRSIVKLIIFNIFKRFPRRGRQTWDLLVFVYIFSR